MSYRGDIRAIFFGNCSFSLYHLKRLRINLETVVTSNERTHVAKYCRENNLEFLNWETYKKNINQFSNELGILISFGKILSKTMIESFARGIINVHPSNLPRWRGPSPLTHAIIAGDKKVGISIMKLAPSSKLIDCGKILAQESYPIDLDIMKSDDLFSFISPKSFNLLSRVLENLDEFENAAQTQRPLNDDFVCVGKNNSLMGSVDFTKLTGMNVNRMWRAFYNSNVRVFFLIYNLKVEISSEPKILVDASNEAVKPYEMAMPDVYSEINAHFDSLKVGELFLLRLPQRSGYYNELFVKTKNNTILVIDKLKPLSHKAINGLDFYNGYLKERSIRVVGKKIKCIGQATVLSSQNPLQNILDANQT